MPNTFYQNIENEIITKYKNNMKTYCVKCKKDTENIDPKIVRTKNKTDYLCSQNVVIAEIKNQDL